MQQSAATTLLLVSLSIFARTSEANSNRQLLCGDEICSASGFPAAAGTGWQTHGSAKGMFCLNNAPLDRETLGHVSWSFLHTTAAYLPSGTLKKEAKDSFVNIMLAIPEIYACTLCRGHFQELITNDPLVLQELHGIKTNVDAVLWLWKVHNMVTMKEKPNEDLFLNGLGLGTNASASRIQIAGVGWFTQNSTKQLAIEDLTPVARAEVFDGVLKRWRAAGGRIEVPSQLDPIPGTAMSLNATEQYEASANKVENAKKTTMKTCDAVDKYFNTLSDHNKTVMCPERHTPTNRRKPEVIVWTMGRCPYCALTMANLYPVVTGELWDKIELKDKYILQADAGQATSLMDFYSLHGPGEVVADAYELCAQHQYKNNVKWLDFVKCTDQVYWAAGLDATQDPALKGFGHSPEECAKKSGIDFELLNKCANGTQGIRLVAADAAQATLAKVDASPTIQSAGHTVVGAQVRDQLEQTVCTAIVCHDHRKKTHDDKFAPATSMYSAASQNAYGNLIISSFALPAEVREPMLIQARQDLGITQDDHERAMAAVPAHVQDTSSAGAGSSFAMIAVVAVVLAAVIAVVVVVSKNAEPVQKGWEAVPTYTHRSTVQCDELSNFEAGQANTYGADVTTHL